MSTNEQSGLSDQAGASREALIERFESAWRNGEQPDIEMYLSGDVAERQLRLVQLVMSDLKFRLSADPIFRVETYLD